MKVRVLGCSGGIGGRHLRTTAMLVDHDILIDAGTGVGELSLDELERIDHVFITHSHLDHIAALPLLIDAVADRREGPVIVHAPEATLELLKNHVFNWAIWPDFSEIAIRADAVMQYRAIEVGQKTCLGGRTITAVPAVHTVPAVGYHLDSGAGSLVFTGDTTSNDELWPLLNAVDNLRYLVIETAFSNEEEALATLSRHLCPTLLRAELAKLKRDAEVFITHLKPGQIERIMREIDMGEAIAGRFKPHMLQNNQIFEF